MEKESCIFCQIIEKKIPATIIDESEHCLAFKDINPMADFHALIIPKIHVASINDLSAEHAHYVSDMVFLAKKLAASFDVPKKDYRLVINTGAGAGQSVFHLHMHLLAGRDFSWPPG